MNNVSGKITISKVSVNNGDDFVQIQIKDCAAVQTFLRVHVELENFAKAILGLGKHLVRYLSKHLACYGYGFYKKNQWVWLCLLSGAFALTWSLGLSLLLGLACHHMLFISAHVVSQHFTGKWFCEPPNDDDDDDFTPLRIAFGTPYGMLFDFEV